MKNQIIKKMQLGMVSLSAIALLAACGNDTQEQTQPTNDPVEETQTPAAGTDSEAGDDRTTGETNEGTQEQAPADVSNGINGVEFSTTMDQAIQTFHETFGEEANIDEISFDVERGSYEYQISGWDDQNEYEIEINAETGDIVNQETDRDSDNDNDRGDILELGDILSPQEAIDIAVQESGSDYVEEWSLEEDDGMTVYDINIENGNDITLNAVTGDIVNR